MLLARHEAQPAGLEQSFPQVAFTAELQKEKMFFHLILNAYWEALDFELPLLASGGRCAGGSTRHLIPRRHCTLADIAMISGSHYRAEPRSVVVLFA